MRRAVGLAVLAALALAAPAQAHTKVKSSNPRSGATVSRSLGSVTITFTGPLRSGTVRVTGPGNRKVSAGNGGRDPRNINRLRVEVRGLKAGRHTVRWSIKAADGHTQSGTFRFRVRG